MVFLEGKHHFADLNSALTVSVMAFRTWSCVHWYSPLPSAFVQQLSLFSRVPRLEHSGHVTPIGDSALPYVCRLDRFGSIWCTAWMRNYILGGSAFQSSAQVTFLSTAPSHIIQVLYCFIPTALQFLLASSAALIFSWTRCCLYFSLVMFFQRIGNDRSPALPRVTTPISLLRCSRVSAS